MLFTSVLVSALLSIAPLTLAAPTDVWAPPIVDPHAGTIWVIGDTVTVAWDNTGIPVNITSPTGILFFSKGGIQMPDDIIASGFSIRAGSTQLVVPDVEVGDDYALVLIGDSGDVSAQFTIVHAPSQ